MSRKQHTPAKASDHIQQEIDEMNNDMIAIITEYDEWERYEDSFFVGQKVFGNDGLQGKIVKIQGNVAYVKCKDEIKQEFLGCLASDEWDF